MAYELVWEPEGVVRRFSGVVSAAEFINSVERVQGDPRYDDMHYVINDFSAAPTLNLSDETFTELAVLHYGAFVSNPNCRSRNRCAHRRAARLVQQGSGDPGRPGSHGSQRRPVDV